MGSIKPSDEYIQRMIYDFRMDPVIHQFTKTIVQLVARLPTQLILFEDGTVETSFSQENQEFYDYLIKQLHDLKKSRYPELFP